MNDKEHDKWMQFQREHKDCRKRWGKRRIHLYIKRYSTGIGTSYTASCDNCKTYEDITDYDCW